ncbi:MAG: Fur family transcriptional regulator [Proteobacteria bacterium]|nr:Fur family transcriptional regulator [Pseudomonadota bacterium]
MPGQMERLCIERGLRMTGQRRIVARVLSETNDHPDAEEVYRLASKLDPKISIATVYRTLRVFEEAGILQRLEFGDGRARFERAAIEHHDHLIDTSSGKVIEFQNVQLEDLQEKIAHDLGYRLVGHRMELFGLPLAAEASAGDKDSGGEC